MSHLQWSGGHCRKSVEIETEVELLFAGDAATEALLALFAVDLQHHRTRGLARIDKGVSLVTGDGIAPALFDNPVANQVAVDPDDPVVTIFLPANDQGGLFPQYLQSSIMARN